MVESNRIDLSCMCRVCSAELNGDGVDIFSKECKETDIADKIQRYLCFKVIEDDKLSKMVCQACLKKLENIDIFAKMSLEMQEKFNQLLEAQENRKPKIKIKSLEAINKEVEIKTEEPDDVDGDVIKDAIEYDLDIEVAVEEIGEEVEEDEEMALKITKTESVNEGEGSKVEQAECADKVGTTDDVDLDEDDEVKPSASLLQSLLLKGKSKSATDTDHDYSVCNFMDANDIKEEPPDPEDEDIEEEIAEDRLNQIIKEELGSDTDTESNYSDIEITEMEVKVDPMLYFSTASQGGNDELEIDSPDELEDNSSSASSTSTSTTTVNTTSSKPHTKTNVTYSSTEPPPLVMTRSQQKVNPVIASLKLGKPYKCSVCPRSFITDIGLQNHLWSHLPKSKKFSPNSGQMMHKNVDMEDSQVYSSNGVLHTAAPSENPHLLKYVCPICGKKISTKGNLKVHLETHRPKGKYGCDICGRVFKTAANLFRHKDYHGGVQFPCPVCGRVYPTNSTLRAHSITHSDVRPHKCPLCSKTFKRNQDLKFHINQHTGARPYQCPYCPKAFASSGNCFSHRKRMHPIEVERDKERAAEIMG